VAGSFSKMDVRVPNERDDKGTTKVGVRLPGGVYFLSYQKVAGWKATVYKRSLADPVDLGGFSVDERYTRVVWKARTRAAEKVHWTGGANADTPAPRVTLLAAEEE
jgi:periplasmic copper chaperone A